MRSRLQDLGWLMADRWRETRPQSSRRERLPGSLVLPRGCEDGLRRQRTWVHNSADRALLQTPRPDRVQVVVEITVRCKSSMYDRIGSINEMGDTKMPGPIDTVNELVRAINEGNVERAVAAYEPDAVLVAKPGQIARGSSQLREALSGFVALHAVLRSEAQDVIEAGDVALYISRWSLAGTDPSGKAVTMGGESTDILRRQSDGRWLITLDNPWGAQILLSTGT